MAKWITFLKHIVICAVMIEDLGEISNLIGSSEIDKPKLNPYRECKISGV